MPVAGGSLIVATLVAAVLPIGGHTSMTLDDLKSAYLACERAAVSEGLETAAVMECSEIYETLKERAFDGSFQKLREWSDAELDRRASAGDLLL